MANLRNLYTVHFNEHQCYDRKGSTERKCQLTSGEQLLTLLPVYLEALPYPTMSLYHHLVDSEHRVRNLGYDPMIRRLESATENDRIHGANIWKALNEASVAHED